MSRRSVFLDRESLIADMRAPLFAHEWIDHAQTRPDEVVARLKDADIAIVNKVKLSADILAQTPKLKMISAAFRQSPCQSRDHRPPSALLDAR